MVGYLFSVILLTALKNPNFFIKRCITYSFSPENINSINFEFLEQNCGISFECCQFLAETNDGLGLTDPTKRWTNTQTKLSESLVISCKVNTKVSFQNLLTQQHQLSTQESGEHSGVHKSLLQKLIVDHLSQLNSNLDLSQPSQPLPQPINSLNQPLSQQSFQSLTKSGLKSTKTLSSTLKTDKLNSTIVIEEIKINSCDVIQIFSFNFLSSI